MSGMSVLDKSTSQAKLKLGCMKEDLDLNIDFYVALLVSRL